MVVKIFIVRSGSKANLCWRFRLMVCFWRAGFHDFGVESSSATCFTCRGSHETNEIMLPGLVSNEAVCVLRLCCGDCILFLTGWWFGTWFLFFHILGMSSSQLTNSYFFQRGRSTTNQLNIEIHDDPRRVPLFFSGLNFWTMEMGKSRDLASLQWGRSCRFAHCQFSNGLSPGAFKRIGFVHLVTFFLGRSISYVFYLMFDTCDGIFVLIWCCWKKSLKPRAVRTGFEADIRR